MKRLLLFLLPACLLACAPAAQKTMETQAQLFTNPLLPKGQDPWLVQEGEDYYYCFSAGGSIGIQQVKQLTDLREADTLIIWTPPENTAYSKELWAPELHRVGDRWYVYVAADDGQNEHHRMHVLVSKGSSISSGFDYAGQLQDPDNKWAIDGTLFAYKERLYFIWSGWEGDTNEAQHLYIAPMESPTKISGKRVLLSSPEYAWEQRGAGNGLPTINEGPQLLYKDGKYYLIYSAAGSWSAHYCLGMLSLEGDDPLQAAAWKKSPEPVFEGTDCVISPGHCSFITIGRQDWIVYHVSRQPEGGWASRYVKMQPFYWNEQGPVFGKPAEDGVLFPVWYE